ncbi:MAG: hypothetical protein IJ462_02730 [Clostridia bacterium]|nr:hypothetical protein [Clostridia bacterium]
MKKKIVSICLVLAILAVAATGTLAYFTDYDGAENTFVFGNISIQQLEKERIEQSDANTDATNIQDFTQDKELFPAIRVDGTNANSGYAAWAPGYQNFPTGGSSKLFTDAMGNVEDKFVFVENDGANDVYFRTIVAIEKGSLPIEKNALIRINANTDHYTLNYIANRVTIGDSVYDILEFVYKRDNNDGKGAGVLSAGATSRPSLLQIYLRADTTQEDVALIDGNDDGKLNVLAVSQAVQTAGFSDAATALDEAFGDLDATSAAAYLAEYKA